MNGMGQGHTPVELVKDQPYYVSGLGIYTYVGPVETISPLLWPTIPKSARNAETPGHKFRSDAAYSQESPHEVIVVDEQLKRGEKIHPVPSAKETEQALRVLLTPGQYNERNHYSHILSVSNIYALSEIVRDHKGQKNNTAQLSKAALSYILAYHMKSLVSQAEDYIDLILKTKTWHSEVPVWPASKETMIRLVEARKKGESFTPELIAELAGRKFIPQAIVAPRAAQKPITAPAPVVRSAAPVSARSVEPMPKIFEPRWTPPVMVPPRAESKPTPATPPVVVIEPAPAAPSQPPSSQSEVSVISASEPAPKDKAFLSENFKIAVRRHPDDVDTVANDHQLELVVHHEEELPIALVAAKALTPMAFDIFSRKYLRGQSVEQIVERVGTNSATVCKVFVEAVQVVEEQLQGRVTSLKNAAADISRKNTLG